METQETMQIVKVKYYIHDDKLSASEYSYYSEVPLNVGDIITVPVRDTTCKAQVSQVDVPESDVAAFKSFTSPLEQADGITRGKIMFYRKDVERQRAEVEEIERQKMELAKREAELNNGEIMVDLTPIAKPVAGPGTVRTDMGNTNMMKVRKWEVEDITKVPADYLQVDSTAIGKLARAGIKSISGIRIWDEDVLRVNTR